MVKRQKEKQYQSARENRENAQLRAGSGMTGGVVQRRLPFHCCALTLVPFTNPVCTLSSGIILESSALMNFLLEHKQDPISGQSLSTKDIITLHMDQDEEGRWQCPILTKPFSDRTKIVAVLDRSANEAYVYSFEAYKELNVKAKNWLDLTTGKKFHPQKDVLILNDPEDEEYQKKRDIQSFWYITSGRSAVEKRQQQTSDVKHSVTATRIMEQIQKEQAKKRKEQESSSTATQLVAKKLKIYSHDVTGVKYTSGKAAGSLTSSAMDVASENITREASQEEILQAQFQVMKTRKEKGYVRMITNLGDMLLELHCDIAPRTCTNFLGLCQAKKYDGTAFHRLIPNFMIQGGKAKVGDEDASLWGNAFPDEFDDRLKHTGSGILSMANAGAGTNKRQFFITFKSCPHLDRKHSVFGEVVDGKAVLEKMQKCATDKKERPIEPITILKMEILVDPAKEAEELEQKRFEELAAARTEEAGRKNSVAVGKKATAPKEEGNGSSSGVSKIGKYLPVAAIAQKDVAEEDDHKVTDFPVLPAPSAKANSAPKATKFGDFSGW